jgi:hypothetical protein
MLKWVEDFGPCPKKTDMSGYNDLSQSVKYLYTALNKAPEPGWLK